MCSVRAAECPLCETSRANASICSAASCRVCAATMAGPGIEEVERFLGLSRHRSLGLANKVGLCNPPSPLFHTRSPLPASSSECCNDAKPIFGVANVESPPLTHPPAATVATFRNSVSVSRNWILPPSPPPPAAKVATMQIRFSGSRSCIYHRPHLPCPTPTHTLPQRKLQRCKTCVRGNEVGFSPAPTLPPQHLQ